MYSRQEATFKGWGSVFSTRLNFDMWLESGKPGIEPPTLGLIEYYPTNWTTITPYVQYYYRTGKNMDSILSWDDTLITMLDDHTVNKYTSFSVVVLTDYLL